MKSFAKRTVIASVKGWLKIWTGKNEIEVELNGSERVQQVAVAGVTVPCLAYLNDSGVSVCAYNDGDANALLRKRTSLRNGMR